MLAESRLTTVSVTDVFVFRVTVKTTHFERGRLAARCRPVMRQWVGIGSFWARREVTDKAPF